MFAALTLHMTIGDSKRIRTIPAKHLYLIRDRHYIGTAVVHVFLTAWQVLQAAREVSPQASFPGNLIIFLSQWKPTSAPETC